MKITRTEQIGQIVLKTRKQQGLSQEQLAAVCGVGVRFIRELEQGKPTSQIGKVLSLLTMLGLDFTIKSE